MLRESISGSVFFIDYKIGVSSKQIQILLNKWLNYLTGKKFFSILTWISSFMFLRKQLWISLKTLFRTKLLPVMAKILFEWINKLKHLLRQKVLFKRLKRKMLNSKLLDKLDASQTKLQSSINFFNMNTIEKPRKHFLIDSLVLIPMGLYWTLL